MSYGLKVFLWVIGLMIFAGIISWVAFDDKKMPANSAENPANAVTFICLGKDSIRADFNTKSVNLKLSDGRNFMLKRARSGSGARYTDDDESIVFWNKGNTAFITENDSMTYRNCVVKGQDDLTNLESYQDKNSHLQFRYPRVLRKIRESVADTSGWSYEEVSKGKLTVQFQLADSLQPKTNLSEATFTIGRSDEKKAVANCMKAPQAPLIETESVQKAGATFKKSTYADAGAGNYYQIRQFRAIRQNSCFSIEEMVHSTNIHNYPAERGITEFDSTRVWKALNVPWQTFRFIQD